MALSHLRALAHFRLLYERGRDECLFIAVGFTPFPRTV